MAVLTVSAEAEVFMVNIFEACVTSTVQLPSPEISFKKGVTLAMHPAHLILVVNCRVSIVKKLSFEYYKETKQMVQILKRKTTRLVYI